jgi:flagellin
VSTRINTNVQSLIGQRVLGQNSFGQSQSLERLSTGLRINRGKDDPAGLIASENLRAEKSALNAAIGNAERADQVANIAEGGLGEVNSLLTELQGLVTNTANGAGLSAQEKAANQLQVDSILQTIDRIASSTSFQGKRLLNGSLDYTTTGVNTSVTDFRINGAKLAGGASLDVQAIVTQSAQTAGLYLSTGATINLGGAEDSTFTIEVGGNGGSRELSFASGTTIAQIAAAVNTFKDVTGVSARTSGTGLVISSTKFGANEFVSAKVVNAANIQGTEVGVYQLTGTNFSQARTDAPGRTAFSAATNGVRDLGQDVGATINGVTATANGRSVRVNTDFLDVELTLSTNASQTRAAVTAFTITGGGADFQLASKVDIAGKVAIGIQDVSTRKLGNSSLGFLSDLASGKSQNLESGKDLTTAQKIVDEAIKQVASTRGRIGAFQKNTVGATIRNLSVGLENTSAAESSIRDADFAKETAALTRSQILVQSSTQVLAQANQSPQAVLGLLRG